jgi:hypothetical protein
MGCLVVVEKGKEARALCLSLSNENKLLGDGSGLAEQNEKTTAEQWCPIGRTLRRSPFADERPGLKLDWRSLEIKGSRAPAAVCRRGPKTPCRAAPPFTEGPPLAQINQN